ncbi:hypothetical protein [Bosea sp. NBC_00550]|uniref:hypothetical protein n=1 Tax=Bosea sp. NBC_00550 TaxID=2969621 RepID=UPI00222F0C57|nr:hypothetical protein [Bosea sp. NBC_00550]UZF93412.1 hypothetical protein NWE53_04180 [Bosea sp. NBC_00550]
MTALDETHDATLRSFEASANGHADFPIQNLPIGVFSPPGEPGRGGIAIGDKILDLKLALEGGLMAEDAGLGEACAQGSLNGFLSLGSAARAKLRRRVSALLARGGRDETKAARCLRSASSCTLHLPARIGDYTDFYVGIHHATEVGKLFRPDNPLLPNYKYVPNHAGIVDDDRGVSGADDVAVDRSGGEVVEGVEAVAGKGDRGAGSAIDLSCRAAEAIVDDDGLCGAGRAGAGSERIGRSANDPAIVDHQRAG